MQRIHAISLSTFILFCSSQVFAFHALIWDRTYSNVSPFEDMNTHFESIEQLAKFDYVTTDLIGLTWDNENGYCKSLFRPYVIVQPDELDPDSAYQLLEAPDSVAPRVRTRDRVVGAKDMPGLFFYAVPPGLNIAKIKLMGIQKSKTSPSGWGRSWLGKCRFKIYARDPVFGTY